MKYYKFSASLLNACAKRLVQSRLFRIRNKRDKGKGENGVQNVERWVIAPLRKQTFFDLNEVNLAMRKQLELLNNKEMQHVGRSRRQEFEEIGSYAMIGI